MQLSKKFSEWGEYAGESAYRLNVVGARLMANRLSLEAVDAVVEWTE